MQRCGFIFRSALPFCQQPILISTKGKTPLRLGNWRPIRDGLQRLMRDKNGPCTKYKAGQIFHKDNWSVKWHAYTKSPESKALCNPRKKLFHDLLPPANYK